MIQNRLDLASYFGECGFKVGAEVGVLGGDYSLSLLKAIPDLKLYAIDSWGLEDPVPMNSRVDAYNQAKEKLLPYGSVLIRNFSLDAVKNFPDNFLDFVYIDANHRFDEVVRDIIEWTKKVKKGGIVSGHDYIPARVCGVMPAVDGYVKAHQFKLETTTDTSEPLSWWFKKTWNV